jgi:hypothetical protein
MLNSSGISIVGFFIQPCRDFWDERGFRSEEFGEVKFLNGFGLKSTLLSDFDLFKTLLFYDPKFKEIYSTIAGAYTFLTGFLGVLCIDLGMLLVKELSLDLLDFSFPVDFLYPKVVLKNCNLFCYATCSIF